MMFDMEKKVRDNLTYFNDREPDLGHKARFADRLGDNTAAKPKKFKMQSFVAIAAAFLLLIATSYFILKTVNIKNGHENLQITCIEYPDELVQVQTYYDELSVSRLDKIDDLAKSEEEAQRLKTKARHEFEKLDASLAMIEKEYVKNPQCNKIEAAIVSNKKMKVKIVDNIVGQMDNAQHGHHAGSMFTNY